MGYEAIADVGKRIIELFCRELVPEVILHDSQIGLCSPDDHDGIKLGIFLYDISESRGLAAYGKVNAGKDRQGYPPSYMSLHYMITAYSDSDSKFRAGEEHRILGRVVQVLRDCNVLSEKELGDRVGLPARIELEKLAPYEKMRLWNFSGIPYRLSLFYQVQPVEISSNKIIEVTRVRDIAIQVQEDKKSIHASLVVLVIDDFTGKPVKGNSIKVMVKGHKAPVIKEDGSRVFVNLTGTSVTLFCESSIYTYWNRTIELAGREDAPFIIRLLPNAHYPLPSGTASISGHTLPGRRLLFWGSETKRYRLFADYDRKEGKENRIAVYGSDYLMMEGKTFFICTQDKKTKEYFTVIKAEEGFFYMDRPLQELYKKAGAVVTPVYEVYADEKGNFFLPMAGNGSKFLELYCQAEEGQEEKMFRVQAGKYNQITV